MDSKEEKILLKILVDEDLRGKAWHSIVERLRADRHDVVWVYDQANGMKGLKDHQLGKIATEPGRMVLTRDVSSFQRDNLTHNQKLPFGLVGLRLNELSPEARVERVSSFISQHGTSLHNHSTILEPGTERIKPMEQVYQEHQQNTLKQKTDAQAQMNTVNQTPGISPRTC